MPYELTPEEVAPVTDVELAFGTTRLLPAWEDIPHEFQCAQTKYCEVVAGIFYGNMPNFDVQLYPEFASMGQQVFKCLRAHITSWTPKHEHKMAGTAYMLAKAMHITGEKQYV